MYRHIAQQGQGDCRHDLLHAQVTREEAHNALEEQFGGDGTTGPTPGFNSMLGPRLSKMSSAYMLLVGGLPCPNVLSSTAELVLPNLHCIPRILLHMLTELHLLLHSTSGRRSGPRSCATCRRPPWHCTCGSGSRYFRRLCCVA